jgi:hypothetical protein
LLALLASLAAGVIVPVAEVGAAVDRAGAGACAVFDTVGVADAVGAAAPVGEAARLVTAGLDGVTRAGEAWASLGWPWLAWPSEGWPPAGAVD